MQLALPSRDYYLKSSSQAELKAYHIYMTQVAVLLGANETVAEAELEKVVEFEKELANVSCHDSVSLSDIGYTRKSNICRHSRLTEREV